MAIDSVAPQSRRALLGATPGAIAATIGQALAHPFAGAAEGETMHVAGDYFARAWSCNSGGTAGAVSSGIDAAERRTPMS
jgi:hypothetical protein